MDRNRREVTVNVCPRPRPEASKAESEGLDQLLSSSLRCVLPSLHVVPRNSCNPVIEGCIANFDRVGTRAWKEKWAGRNKEHPSTPWSYKQCSGYSFCFWGMAHNSMNFAGIKFSCNIGKDATNQYCCDCMTMPREFNPDLLLTRRIKNLMLQTHVSFPLSWYIMKDDRN